MKNTFASFKNFHETLEKNWEKFKTRQAQIERSKGASLTGEKRQKVHFEKSVKPKSDD